jgi:hypothetical protein
MTPENRAPQKPIAQNDDKENLEEVEDEALLEDLDDDLDNPNELLKLFDSDEDEPSCEDYEEEVLEIQKRLEKPCVGNGRTVIGINIPPLDPSFRIEQYINIGHAAFSPDGTKKYIKEVYREVVKNSSMVEKNQKNRTESKPFILEDYMQDAFDDSSNEDSDEQDELEE